MGCLGSKVDKPGRGRGIDGHGFSSNPLMLPGEFQAAQARDTEAGAADGFWTAKPSDGGGGDANVIKAAKARAQPKPKPGDPGYVNDPAAITAAVEEANLELQARSQSKPKPGEPGYINDPAAVKEAVKEAIAQIIGPAEETYMGVADQTAPVIGPAGALYVVPDHLSSAAFEAEQASEWKQLKSSDFFGDNPAAAAPSATSPTVPPATGFDYREEADRQAALAAAGVGRPGTKVGFDYAADAEREAALAAASLPAPAAGFDYAADAEREAALAFAKQPGSVGAGRPGIKVGFDYAADAEREAALEVARQSAASGPAYDTVIAAPQGVRQSAASGPAYDTVIAAPQGVPNPDARPATRGYVNDTQAIRDAVKAAKEEALARAKPKRKSRPGEPGYINDEAAIEKMVRDVKKAQTYAKLSGNEATQRASSSRKPYNKLGQVAQADLVDVNGPLDSQTSRQPSFLAANPDYGFQDGFEDGFGSDPMYATPADSLDGNAGYTQDPEAIAAAVAKVKAEAERKTSVVARTSARPAPPPEVPPEDALPSWVLIDCLSRDRAEALLHQQPKDAGILYWLVRPKEAGRYSVSHLAKSRDMSHHILQFLPDGKSWTFNGGSTDLEGRPATDLGLTLDVVVPKLIEQARRITSSRMAQSVYQASVGSTAAPAAVAGSSYSGVQMLGPGADIVEVVTKDGGARQTTKRAARDGAVVNMQVAEPLYLDEPPAAPPAVVAGDMYGEVQKLGHGANIVEVVTEDDGASQITRRASTRNGAVVNMQMDEPLYMDDSIEL